MTSEELPGYDAWKLSSYEESDAAQATDIEEASVVDAFHQIVQIGEHIEELDASGRDWCLYRSWCAPNLGVIAEVGRPGAGGHVGSKPFFEAGDGLEAVLGALRKAVKHVRAT